MKKRANGLYCRTITVNGKRRYFYGKSQREVNQKILDFRSQKDDRLFADVAEEWAEKHRDAVSDKCWNNYRPHFQDIVDTHGKKSVSEITALDVQTDLLKAKSAGCSATIISTRRSLYRMILDYAMFNGWISHNPAASVRMPKGIKRNTREAPEDDAVRIILQNADKPFGLYPLFLLCTGMRKSEVLCLEWSDVKDGYIEVTKALDYTNHAHPKVKLPKTDAGIRTVPLNEPLRSILNERRPKRGNGLIFPPMISNLSRSENTESYMTERQFETAWKNYCRVVGLIDSDGKPTITAHQLRHGFATIGFEAGVDEKTMQSILGHASPTVTREIYQHLREKEKALSEKKLTEQFERILKQPL